MRVRYISIVMLLLFFGCAAQQRDQIIKDSYRALGVGGHTYDTAMTTMAMLHKEGKLNDEEKELVIKYGTYYHDAYHVSVEALKLYKQTDGKEGDIQGTLLKVGQALGEFLSYINAVLAEYDMEEFR